jgi:hypothetical protein
VYPVYLLVKSIKLNDSRVPRQDLQLVSFGGATPLGVADVAAVEGEGVAATRGTPAQTTLGQLAFSRLLREVQVYVIKALPIRSTRLALLKGVGFDGTEELT